ncbi:MAG: hypothetical protein JNK58_01560 [Phycisphaerae bacterium]|nr:hypothetical protein [Phycisphaerae bacterium]
MMTSISCLARSLNHAYRIIQRLRTSGVPGEHISVLALDFTNHGSVTADRDSILDEAALGKGTTGVIASTLGTLNGVGVIVVPGIGPIIAAGPILAQLDGAAAPQHVSGAIERMGVPTDAAASHEPRIAGGDVFIAVNSISREQLGLARRAFEEAGADDIRDAMETAPPESSPHEAPDQAGST